MTFREAFAAMVACTLLATVSFGEKPKNPPYMSERDHPANYTQDQHIIKQIDFAIKQLEEVKQKIIAKEKGK